MQEHTCTHTHRHSKRMKRRGYILYKCKLKTKAKVAQLTFECRQRYTLQNRLLYADFVIYRFDLILRL